MEELVERLPGHDLDDPTEDVGRNPVVPLCSRLEGERERRPPVAALGEIGPLGRTPLEPGVAVQRIGDVLVVESVCEARCVRQQVPHPDRFDERIGDRFGGGTRAVDASVGERRDEVRHRVLQLEPALLVEHHRGNRGDRLGHREQADDGVVTPIDPCVTVAVAGRGGVHHVAASGSRSPAIRPVAHRRRIAGSGCRSGPVGRRRSRIRPDR